MSNKRAFKNISLPLIYHLIQQYHSWGYTQKTVTQVTPEAPAHPCLLQHYSQYPSYGNSQDAPPPMNGLRKCGIYTQWNFMQP
jgi:hypothetical protein